MDFYLETVERMVRLGIVSPSDSVLAVCAGSYDRDVLLKAGFVDVIISNLDYHSGVSSYDPFPWQAEDAESLSLDDGSVDWSLVHAGLHHCGSPHKALCEMMRVSKKGVIVFESRDSLLIRLAVRAGLTVDYELEPVALSSGKGGGYRNLPIPNYIYRWNEREVKKTAYSYDPTGAHELFFFYGYTIPLQRLAMSRSTIKKSVAKLGLLLQPVLRIAVPKQGNRFAFVVKKSEALYPWLRKDSSSNLAPNMDYLSREFETAKYKPGSSK